MFRTIPSAIFLARVDKSEGLEYLRILVEMLIIVERSGGRGNQRSFRYESPI